MSEEVKSTEAAGEAKSITVEEAKELSAPLEKFLCGFFTDRRGVQFTSFRIEEMIKGTALLEVHENPDLLDPAKAPKDFDGDKLRKIDYKFPVAFLAFPKVKTVLTFKAKSPEPKQLTLIEHHYFKGKVLKKYYFTKKIKATEEEQHWDCIYDLPELTKAQVDEMQDNPRETTSDSLYFVDGVLIMHNKASYTYV